MKILTRPGTWHNLKVRFVSFVFYFVPLYIAINWILERVYSSKHCPVFMLSDFPDSMIEQQGKVYM